MKLLKNINLHFFLLFSATVREWSIYLKTFCYNDKFNLVFTFTRYHEGFYKIIFASISRNCGCGVFLCLMSFNAPRNDLNLFYHMKCVLFLEALEPPKIVLKNNTKEPIIKSGDSYELVCKGNSPLSWEYPEITVS